MPHRPTPTLDADPGGFIALMHERLDEIRAELLYRQRSDYVAPAPAEASTTSPAAAEDTPNDGNDNHDDTVNNETYY